MTIPEACRLVLEAGSMGNGGEIYIFDMGKPVKIVDLAKRMISLSGRTDVKIEFTGLRHGEKLYEELLNVKELTKPTYHEKIMIATVREYDYDEVKERIQKLIDVSYTYDQMKIVAAMKDIVPEFVSLLLCLFQAYSINRTFHRYLLRIGSLLYRNLLLYPTGYFRPCGGIHSGRQLIQWYMNRRSVRAA